MLHGVWFNRPCLVEEHLIDQRMMRLELTAGECSHSMLENIKPTTMKSRLYLASRRPGAGREKERRTICQVSRPAQRSVVHAHGGEAWQKEYAEAHEEGGKREVSAMRSKSSYSFISSLSSPNNTFQSAAQMSSCKRTRSI